MAMLEAFVHDPLINWRLLNGVDAPTTPTNATGGGMSPVPVSLSTGGFVDTIGGEVRLLYARHSYLGYLRCARKSCCCCCCMGDVCVAQPSSGVPRYSQTHMLHWHRRTPTPTSKRGCWTLVS